MAQSRIIRVVFIGLLCFMMLIFSSACSEQPSTDNSTPVEPSPTIEAVIEATQTPIPLETDFLSLPGVRGGFVTVMKYRDREGWNIYSELLVDAEIKNTDTTDQLLQMAMRRYGAFFDFSVIMDDCDVAIDYNFDKRKDSWRQTELSMNSAECENG